MALSCEELCKRSMADIFYRVSRVSKKNSPEERSYSFSKSKWERGEENANWIILVTF